MTLDAAVKLVLLAVFIIAMATGGPLDETFCRKASPMDNHIAPPRAVDNPPL